MTNDYNDPDFWKTENLDRIAKPASLSDYGPGPNEEISRAKANSPAFARDLGNAPAEPLLPPPPSAQPSLGADQMEELANLVVSKLKGDLG